MIADSNDLSGICLVLMVWSNSILNCILYLIKTSLTRYPEG